MAELRNWTCQTCGQLCRADTSDDGFCYCPYCGSQTQDFVDTGVADEDFVATAGAIYTVSHCRRNKSAIKVEPISQSQPQFNTPTIQSQFWSALTVDDETPKPSKIKMEDYDFSVGPFSDGYGPTDPEDFGSFGKSNLSYEDCYDETRMRYVMGLQLMIEFQCEALVREFKVSPLICGLAGTVWLRFVAQTRVFDDDFREKVTPESDIQEPQGEPLEGHKRQAVNRSDMDIWYRSLRKEIPLSYTLAVSFLVCHLAREAVLPTDIVKWSLEGKLPYLDAFVEIEKRIGQPPKTCPVSSSIMFRPTVSVTAQILESRAACIAKSIGLALPSVNFYAIASRYLQKLSLPVQKILPHACRIYEWSMPPDLWLSANHRRLPTRVCVMSILIVAIRILYKIHGFGEWEKSLSRRNASSRSSRAEVSDTKHSPEMEESPQTVDDSGNDHVRGSSRAQKSESDVAGLLCSLEARYKELDEHYEYSKDLQAYLQFCKNVVFAGLEPSFEDYEEQKLINQLWDFYQNDKDSKTKVQQEARSASTSKQKRSRVDEEYTNSAPKERKKFRDKGYASYSSSEHRTPFTAVSKSEDGDQNSTPFTTVPKSEDGDQNSTRFTDVPKSEDGDQNSRHTDQTSTEYPKEETTENLKDEAIRRLKLDMEENRFCYIPPRVDVRRFDYLHYVRKRDEGALTYATHADYYILLRACAKVAQVDIRIMHNGVLGFEKRLAWLEQRITHCLHLTPPTLSCKFCSDLGNDNVDELSD
ncbi:hypothetical protein UlMin_041246 [Ulmus minor]